MDLLPAVDVRAGEAVQLVQGDLDRARRYGDPIHAAARWQAGGARWVHLVDIDAAFGHGHNRELLARIVDQLDVDVQLSGGIVDEATLEVALATNARRVVLGASALADLDWCERALADHGTRVVVGLDVRGAEVAPRGGGPVLGELTPLLEWLRSVGSPRCVVTDVDRDGALGGPNLKLLERVVAVAGSPVIACGGVAEVADISALRSAGVDGVIVGSALAQGRFTLEAAIGVAEG